MATKKMPLATTALPYLQPEALTFLRNLARHNDREWFQPRKAQFEAELKEPMLAIVRKVTEAMLDFAPAFVRPAEKCLFRIYRDTRFSNDKRPYKTHAAAWWSHQGLEKTSGAGYYFHVSAKEVIIAAGAYMPEKDQLSQIRHWLLDHHAEFRALLQKPAVRKTFSEFEGNALTRPPKGFPAEHPGMDLIRCRQWGLAATLPASAALKKDFAATLIKYFKIAAPIVDALNTPIVAAQAPKKRVLFGLK
jgi:TIGR02453 family protein